MNSQNYLIDLNFLSLTSQNFEFRIYRKQREESEQGGNSDWYRGSLPISSKTNESQEAPRANYWISLNQEKGFEAFQCHCRDNHFLTKYVLQYALETQLALANLSYERSKTRFERAIRLKIKEHPEGWEVILLEPYYLSVAEKFGFLVNFEFRKRESVLFSKRVQQLSLSLDEYGKSNSNFYVDRLKKVQAFVTHILGRDRIFPLQGNLQQEIDIERSFYPVEAKELSPRTYIFGREREGQTQFTGLRQFGPLKPVDSPVHFYFTFIDECREYAVDLYQALCGKQHVTTFAGMQSVFGIFIDKHNTQRSSLRVFNRDNVQQLVQDIKATSPVAAIHIAVLPSKESKSEYFDLKYHSLQENLPLQIVTLDLLKNETAFKWSVSNIGLQIFAKLGGKPWKVKPNHQNCLIIGIGQAHQIHKNETGQTIVDKYFAYSVLMDSSGIYKDIKILGNSTNQERYLNQLQTQIGEIVRHFRGEFKQFVIHTPFKLKHRELNAIVASYKDFNKDSSLTEIEFVVMKVNTDNKFFGYDQSSNSLIPYESTCLQLSSREFLIWFEGVHHSKPKINKRFSGPTHIEFYYTNRNLSYLDKRRYLQDMINLSGANWRGFNAKSIPVSIYYCKLIAKKIKEFHALGYENFKIDTFTPWFL